MPQGDPMGYDQGMQQSMQQAGLSATPQDPAAPIGEDYDMATTAASDELTFGSSSSMNRDQRIQRLAGEPSPATGEEHPMLLEAEPAHPLEVPLVEPDPSGEVQSNSPMNQDDGILEDDEDYLPRMAMYKKAFFPEEKVVYKPTGEVVEISGANEPEIGEYSVEFPDGSTLRVDESELAQLADSDTAELSPELRAAAAKYAEIRQYYPTRELEHDTGMDLTDDFHADYADTTQDHVYFDTDEPQLENDTPPPVSEHYASHDAWMTPYGHLRRKAAREDDWEDDDDLAIRSFML